MTKPPPASLVDQVLAHNEASTGIPLRPEFVRAMRAYAAGRITRVEFEAQTAAVVAQLEAETDGAQP